VRTGADGRAELQLHTGSVRLYESSLLRLPDAPAAGTGSERVRMERGGSLFDVLRRSGSDRFEVETPEVAVMVKGTRFSVALADGAASVSVWRGSVGVRAFGASLEHEMLVRPGFAAVGGHGAPFELVLNPAEDPWQDWQRGLPPPAPLAAGPASVEERLARAREAARAQLETTLEQHPELGRKLAEPEPGAPDRKEGRPRVQPVEPPPAALDPSATEEKLVPEVDPVTDPMDPLTHKVQEKAAESALAGQTGATAFDVQVVTSGGPNRAVITGPGVAETLTKSQVESILQSGDPTQLPPALLNQLVQNGVDPIGFVETVEDML
jgi:hypothetical protein